MLLTYGLTYLESAPSKPRRYASKQVMILLLLLASLDLNGNYCSHVYVPRGYEKLAHGGDVQRTCSWSPPLVAGNLIESLKASTDAMVFAHCSSNGNSPGIKLVLLLLK